MKHKRRHYITDKGYQWRIALRIVSICFMYLLVNIFLFNYLSYKRLEVLQWRMHVPVESTGEIIKPYLLYSTAISAAFAIITLFIFIWYILDKASGPIYRLKSYIDNVADGNLSADVYLRKRDDFKNTADDLNKMVSALRTRFAFIKNGFSLIERTLEKIEYIKDKPDSAKEECNNLIETINSLKKGIRR